MKKYLFLATLFIASVNIYANSNSIPTIAEVSTLPEGTETSVSGVVSMVSGGTFWMEDATGGLMCYTEDHGLIEGDSVVLNGKTKIYYGIIELTDITIESKIAGNMIIPPIVSMADIVADTTKYMSRLVKLDGVCVNYADDYFSPNVYLSDGINHILAYRLTLDEDRYPEGTKVNATVVVSGYNGTLQFRTKAEYILSSFDNVDGLSFISLGDDTVAVIAHYSTPYTGDIVIPETIKVDNETYRVTGIHNSAFANCSGLTSITIPNSVTHIGNSAFKGCSSLVSITIPENVTKLASSAFWDCSNLTSITWNAKNCADFSGGIYNSSSFYEIRSQITSFTFGDNVQHIPAFLCREMTNLTSVTLPENITSVGRSVFYGCSSLTEPVYNKNVFAFLPPTHVGEYIIPDGIKMIAGTAIAGCSNLTSITIPESVTTVGDRAFTECSNLTDIVWNAKNCTSAPFSNIASQITSFTFGEDVISIPAALCQNMSKLTAITIPNSVTEIGYSVFSGCSSLTAPVYNANIFAFMPTNYSGVYTIPDSIYTIAGGAFEYCSNLTAVTIPNSMTSIGEAAFANCTGLVELMALPTTPPTTAANAFSGVPIGADVKVPCGTALAYRTSTGWTNFNYITETFAYKFEVSSQDETTGLVQILQQPSCDLPAIIKALPMDGYKFQMWSDGNTLSMRQIIVDCDMSLSALFVPIDDTTNGVESVIIDSNKSIRKVLENGTIYIIRNGEKYTVDGRKVE